MNATAPEPDSGPSAVFGASWPPVLLMLMLAVCFLLGDHTLPSQRYDQDLYHIQVIRQFETQLPTPDVSNYGAATGPGYHLVYALVGSVIGSDIQTLRWFSPIIAIGLIVVVAGFCTTCCKPITAALLTAPLAVSYYLLGSAVYLQTDNLAWLLVALALGPLVFRPATGWTLLASGVFLLLAVFVRQNFIWVAGPIVLSGLLTTSVARRIPPWQIGGEKIESTARSLWLFGLLAVVPGCLLLGWFRWIWGGLVPPNFQYFHSFHVVWVAAGFALAVVGLYAPFFLLALPRCRGLIRQHSSSLILAGLIGGACALVPSSGFDPEFGRSGGLMWKLVRLGPEFADRSLVLGFFSTMGAASILLIWFAICQAGRQRGGLVLLCGWLASTSTMFVNSQSYQRYYDFPSLLVLVWGIALCLRGHPAADRRVAYGPPLLAVILASLFAISIV